MIAPFPTKINVDLTNHCQLRCIMCPLSQMQRGKGFMSRSLFYKMVDECSAHHTRLWLHYVGEPTLHPDLVEFVTYACQKKTMQIGFSTNGISLFPPLSRSLIEAGLDRLDISLDASTPEIYRRIRKGGHLTVVESNLQELLIWRERLKTNRPKIALQIVKLPENPDEEMRLLQRWRDLLQPDDFIKTIDYSNFAGQIKQNHALTLEKTPQLEPSRCQWILEYAVILWDGRLSVCPNDYEGKLSVGDITSAKIEDIWQNVAYTHFRKRHQDGDISPDMLCYQCPDFYGTHRGRFQYDRLIPSFTSND